MKELEQLQGNDLIMAFFRNGYTLKSAGTGVFVKKNTFKSELSESEARKIIKERTPDILKYFDETYPEELLQESLELLSRVESFKPSVKTAILYEINQSLQELVRTAEDCESPLEFDLFLHVKGMINELNRRHSTYFWVHTQYPVVANGHSYRADILIATVGVPGNTRYPQLIIECDGHDFHERTKEQARRDKQRDRDLQMAGYRVIRFTGSEIFRNPHKCAREVANFVETLI